MRIFCISILFLFSCKVFSAPKQSIFNDRGFKKGTFVCCIDNKLKEINDFESEEIVESYDLKCHKQIFCKSGPLYVGKGPYVKITLKNAEEIVSGLNQKILTSKKSWKFAKDFNRDDFLMSFDGKDLKVQNVEFGDSEIDLYDFTVKPTHTYGLTKSKICVHNPTIIITLLVVASGIRYLIKETIYPDGKKVKEVLEEEPADEGERNSKKEIDREVIADD